MRQPLLALALALSAAPALAQTDYSAEFEAGRIRTIQQETLDLASASDVALRHTSIPIAILPDQPTARSLRPIRRHATLAANGVRLTALNRTCPLTLSGWPLRQVIYLDAMAIAFRCDYYREEYADRILVTVRARVEDDLFDLLGFISSHNNWAGERINSAPAVYGDAVILVRGTSYYPFEGQAADLWIARSGDGQHTVMVWQEGRHLPRETLDQVSRAALHAIAGLDPGEPRDVVASRDLPLAWIDPRNPGDRLVHAASGQSCPATDISPTLVRITIVDDKPVCDYGRFDRPWRVRAIPARPGTTAAAVAETYLANAETMRVLERRTFVHNNAEYLRLENNTPNPLSPSQSVRSIHTVAFVMKGRWLFALELPPSPRVEPPSPEAVEAFLARF